VEPFVFGHRVGVLDSTALHLTPLHFISLHSTPLHYSKLKSWLYGRPLIAESGQRQRYFPANYTAPATCVAPLRRNCHDQVAIGQKHLSLPLLLLLLLPHYSLITNKSRMAVVMVAEEGLGKRVFFFWSNVIRNRIRFRIRGVPLLDCRWW